jgi:hypothetical protein
MAVGKPGIGEKLCLVWVEIMGEMVLNKAESP